MEPEPAQSDGSDSSQIPRLRAAPAPKPWLTATGTLYFQTSRLPTCVSCNLFETLVLNHVIFIPFVKSVSRALLFSEQAKMQYFLLVKLGVFIYLLFPGTLVEFFVFESNKDFLPGCLGVLYQKYLW